MKRDIIKKITLCGCLAAGVGLTSCDDFLTITPSSSIVEEEFWEDRNDLENVIAACYARLVKDDMLKTYILWGEARSDNFEKNSGVSWVNLDNLMNANLIPTNNMFDWTLFYNEINYCNKVLVHGPEILEKDESFSDNDWLPMRAEAMALRALSHFWLVRTFGEIPYVTKDYNNDGQDFLIAQSTQQQALDSIIMDLEAIKGDAMKEYGNTVYNKGRITQKAVYAILADAYLWRASKNASADSVAIYGNQSRADYEKCIECCDFIIEKMREEKIDYIKKYVGSIGASNIEITDEDLLIPNEISVNTTYVTSYGAYENIFGQGNSEESIFELQLDGTNNANTMVVGDDKNSYFMTKNAHSPNLIVCSAALYSSALENVNTLTPSAVFSKTDYRCWETMQYTSADQDVFGFSKFDCTEVQQSNGTSASSDMSDNRGTTFKYLSSSRSLPNDANWIMYRLTDIMLMKAEAMSQIYSDEDHLREAFTIVRNIFKRSNPYAYATKNTNAATDSLNFATFSSQEGIEALVFAERQREFVGEGKRWFDLVRYAQRRGETSSMISKFLGRKYATNSKAISAKLATIKSLFSPIYNNEIKKNSLLHQNSVWALNESTSKTDEL
ncbi:MAG: RagB/SusD family nutrient uptake outer membrane protein [Bacteroides sp.]|nr:RagB/SusD family nutrient uptake outer membrane protein [Roseburia sp.]MCM1346204.1 RagB/SusD family nutrient uptake outer membrane protein [Bacteroides sp.]MCM1419969.1 RagB/SusD family nutrient uptake outer membrane protein [Bacteroides sp.]